MTELDWEVDEKGVLCYNIPTVHHIWGSKTTMIDLHNKLQKKGYNYYIPRDSLEKRREVLQKRYNKVKTTLEVIDKLLEDINKKKKEK